MLTSVATADQKASSHITTRRVPSYLLLPVPVFMAQGSQLEVMPSITSQVITGTEKR